MWLYMVLVNDGDKSGARISKVRRSSFIADVLEVYLAFSILYLFGVREQTNTQSDITPPG